MTNVWSAIENTLWNVFNRPEISDFVDILFVAFILYKLLMFMRETRASAVLKGVVLLLAATWVSDLVGMRALNWLLMTVVSNGALVLIILFQPELRKALEAVGRSARIEHHTDDEEERTRVIDEIIQCLTDLSRRRVGALIVFEQKTGLKDVVETGTAIDAVISAPLLENIFEPNTPLHDGAVIVRGTRVVAGACILTLTEGSGVSRELGTRHRAAIGVSETTDATVLIVSEETGVISMAKGGKLTRYLDATSLREILEGMYAQPTNGLKEALRLVREKKEAAK